MPSAFHRRCGAAVRGSRTADIVLKLGCQPAPFLLGFVLGPMMEENFRRVLRLSRGDPTVFFAHPISLTLLVPAATLLLVILAPAVRKKREEAFREE